MRQRLSRFPICTTTRSVESDEFVRMELWIPAIKKAWPIMPTAGVELGWPSITTPRAGEVSVLTTSQLNPQDVNIFQSFSESIRVPFPSGSRISTNTKRPFNSPISTRVAAPSMRLNFDNIKHMVARTQSPGRGVLPRLTAETPSSRPEG
jgi:hypothetical protein